MKETPEGYAVTVEDAGDSEVITVMVPVQFTIPKIPRANKYKLAVSIAEAADLLSLGERTVRDLIYRGEIAVVECGTRKLVEVAELDRWLAASRSPRRAYRGKKAR